MRALVGTICLLAAAHGCAQKKEPTPHFVSAEFHALLDSLDINSPGASTQSLESFLDLYHRYEIADSARLEMSRFQSAIDGRYHRARELARDGDFERAEHMLEDLAQVPDTDDGTSARRHLEYDLYYEKAKWLLYRQRFEESEQVARNLLTRDLNRFQSDQVEQILDHVSNVDAAIGMSERASAEGACRQLVVFLANLYINEGRYPDSLTLSELKRLDPHSSRTIIDELASIEDYRATQDNYSLVAVGKRGERFRIVDGKIEE